MAAGVYIMAVSDRGLERLMVSVKTIHLPLSLSLSYIHFLFPLSHCLTLVLLL